MLDPSSAMRGSLIILILQLSNVHQLTYFTLLFRLNLADGLGSQRLFYRWSWALLYPLWRSCKQHGTIKQQHLVGRSSFMRSSTDGQQSANDVKVNNTHTDQEILLRCQYYFLFFVYLEIFNMCTWPMIKSLFFYIINETKNSYSLLIS